MEVRELLKVLNEKSLWDLYNSVKWDIYSELDHIRN